MKAKDLRAWRLRLGLTQARAAELLGIAWRTYMYYESRKRTAKPIPEPIRLLTEALERDRAA